MLLRRAASLLLLLMVCSGVACVLPLPPRRTGVVFTSQRLRFSHSLDCNCSTFKVAIMADLHYGENAWTDWGPAQDVKSTAVQDYILDTEQPNFVVYLGDLVTSNNIAAANASAYWSMATAPAEKRRIPFATTFGNHDDLPMEFEDDWFGPSGNPLSTPEGTDYYQRTTRQQLLASEQNSRLSLTRAGPKSLWPSLSNYVLEVGSSKNNGSLAALFYFLDSGGGTYPEVLSTAQAAWFTSTAEALNPDCSVPEFIFFHIPTLAHRQIRLSPGDPIEAPCVGSINLEGVAAQIAEWGVVASLTNRSSVKATFSGHNHGLDWCCPHENMWLCFARHTGYGGYGNWTRGSRILEISDAPTFSVKSWIRLENGGIVAETELIRMLRY